MATELEQALQRLIGIACWSTVAGRGTGSAFALDFGGRVEREPPLANPHLTPEQRRFIGEVWIHVMCSWRLECGSSILCGSGDDDTMVDTLVRGLDRLVGATVQRTESRDDGRDLTIAFDRDLALRIFVDTSATEADHYTISVDGKTVSR